MFVYSDSPFLPATRLKSSILVVWIGVPNAMQNQEKEREGGEIDIQRERQRDRQIDRERERGRMHRKMQCLDTRDQDATRFNPVLIQMFQDATRREIGRVKTCIDRESESISIDLAKRRNILGRMKIFSSIFNTQFDPNNL